MIRDQFMVVSPHLDDAVFSLGGYLALSKPGQTILLTVLAGVPEADLATAYDVGCGFGSAREAMESRRLEDRDAALVLGLTYRHLDFIDSQYGKANHLETITAALKKLLQREYESAALVAPLGIVHPDHRVVGEACVEAATGRRLLLYEELPYRVQAPEFAAERLAALRCAGWDLDLLPMPTPPPGRKLAAVGCYRSQAPDPTDPCLHAPERLWEATPK